MRLNPMVDDLIHIEPFLFSFQELTEGKCSSGRSEDEAVKWLDQFIVCPKFFVKRKISRGCHVSLRRGRGDFSHLFRGRLKLRS